MSRCFPYPPPYYDESLIELIKLQKEKENSKLDKKKKKEKKHRNKEEKEKKDKEKKEKEKREKKESKEKRKGDCASQDPQIFEPKEQNQKRKFEDIDGLQTSKFYIKKSNEGVELLEGSGVTEEHEPPCSIQHNCESSESSQDSNKRRKLTASVPIHNNNGNILRIKLPVARQNDHEIQSVPGVVKINSGLKSSPPVVGHRDQEQKSKPVLVEGNNPQLKAPQLLGHKKVQLNAPTLKRKHELLPTTSGSQSRAKVATDFQPTVGQNAPVSSKPLNVSATGQKNPDVKCIPLSTPKLKFKVEDGPTASGTQALIKLPAASRRDSQTVGQQKDLELNTASTPFWQKDPSLPKVGLKDPEALDLRFKCVGKEAPGTSEPPCFSGRTSEAADKVKSHKSKGRRTRTDEKFAELFVNWKPPLLQLDTADVCDEDWLFGASKPRASPCVNKYDNDTKALSNVGSSTSLQPRASYMPELDMYILPYAIPF